MTLREKIFNRSTRLTLILFLGYGVVMLLMATSLAITLKSTANVKQNSQDVLLEQLPQMLAFMELEKQLNLSLSHLNEFLISGDEDDKLSFERNISWLKEQSVSAGFSAHIEAARLEKLKALIEQYSEVALKVIRLKQNDLENYLGVAKAAELLNPLHQQYIGTLDALIDEQLANQNHKPEVLQQLIKTRKSWINMIMSLRVYFTTRGDRDYQRIFLYQEQNQLDMQAMAKMRPLMGFDALFVDELMTIHDQYMQNLPIVLDVYQQDTWRLDTYLTRRDVYPIVHRLRALLTSMVNEKKNETQKRTFELAEEMNALSSISKVTFFISLIIGFIAIYVVARNIKQIVDDLDKSRVEADDRAKMLKETSDELSHSLTILQSTQSQLVENEKMASLGNLVAGIAHEINTPLGIGVTASSHIADKTREIERKFNDGTIKKSDFAQYIQETQESNKIMLTNLRRAADLIRSFKQVAVDQSSEELRHFELCQYLHEIYNSLIPNLKKTDITVEIECHEEIYLDSYPGAFAQIITNLMMNSIKHGYDTGESGTIKIVSINEDSAAITIIYQDDGKGMDKETLHKVFEPFFTTKRGQGGSGLGMHLVYNLITQKLKGRVSVKSKEGEGMTVTMTLPTKLDSRSESDDR